MDVVRTLMFVGIAVIILSALFILGAGINEKTLQVIKTIVTDPSAAFNDTVESAQQIQTTGASFIQIPVIALLGGVALVALAGVAAVFGLGGQPAGRM